MQSIYQIKAHSLHQKRFKQKQLWIKDEFRLFIKPASGIEYCKTIEFTNFPVELGLTRVEQYPGNLCCTPDY